MLKRKRNRAESAVALRKGKQVKNEHSRNRSAKRTKTNKKKGAEVYSRRGAFPFLSLPGEIRNQIYRYVLVVPAVKITARPVKDTVFLDQSPRPSGRNARVPTTVTGLTRKVRKRKTWAVSEEKLQKALGFGGYIGGSLAPEHMWYLLQTPAGFHARSYEFVQGPEFAGAPHYIDRNMSVALNLFLANKQIYGEASSIFYAENTFHFSLAWQDCCSCPLAFLDDRRYASTMITSIHLEVTAPYRQIQIPVAASRPLPSPMVSQAQWTRLVRYINDNMSLRHFGFGITIPWTVVVNSPLESPDSEMCEWIETLLQLKPFSSLALKVKWGWNPQDCAWFIIQKLVCVLAQFRESLLQGGRVLGKRNMRVQKQLPQENMHPAWMSSVVVSCYDDNTEVKSDSQGSGPEKDGVEDRDLVDITDWYRAHAGKDVMRRGLNTEFKRFW